MASLYLDYSYLDSIYIHKVAPDVIKDYLKIPHGYPVDNPTTFKYPPAGTERDEFLASFGLEDAVKFKGYLNFVDIHPELCLRNGDFWKTHQSDPWLYDVIHLLDPYIKTDYPSIPTGDRFGNISSSAMESFFLSYPAAEEALLRNDALMIRWPQYIKEDFLRNPPPDMGFFYEMDDLARTIEQIFLFSTPIICMVVFGGFISKWFSSNEHADVMTPILYIDMFLAGMIIREKIRPLAKVVGLIISAIVGIFKGQPFLTLLWLLAQMALLLLKYIIYVVLDILVFIRRIPILGWIVEAYYQGLRKELGLDEGLDPLQMNYLVDLFVLVLTGLVLYYLVSGILPYNVWAIGAVLTACFFVALYNPLMAILGG